MTNLIVTACKNCPFCVHDFYTYCNLTAENTPMEINDLNIIPEFCKLAEQNEILVSIKKNQ